MFAWGTVVFSFLFFLLLNKLTDWPIDCLCLCSFIFRNKKQAHRRVRLRWTKFVFSFHVFCNVYENNI
jgi:hypothetical protein